MNNSLTMAKPYSNRSPLKALISPANGAARRIAGGLSALFLVLCVSACKPGGVKGPPPQEQAPVRVGTVSQQSVPVEVSAIGTVEPIQTVQVKAQVSGPIVEVLFQDGDMVRKGDVLFVIDKRPFEVALEQAEADLARVQAQLEQAQANLNKDKAQVDNARAILARDEDLAKKGMVSREELDTSRTNVAALQAAAGADAANVKAATESIDVAKASIDDAKLQLEYCTIRSPIDGKTGMALLTVGNSVKANDTVAMLVINQIAPIYVDFAVPEKYLSDIQRYSAQGPLNVTASHAERPEASVAGVLTFIDNAIDDVKSIHLRATFMNEDNQLWPGQFVRIVLQITEEENVAVAPSQAVQTGQEGAYVFVVGPDQKAELRKVTVGDTVGNLIVVREGLKPGETVVTDGQLRLMGGTPLKVLADAPNGEEPAP